MKIVIIDNCNWESQVGNLAEDACHFIPTLYQQVGSLQIERCYEAVIDDLAGLSKESGLIYLINIHCIFGNGAGNLRHDWHLQDQEGVTLYRNLLKLYENDEASLKVAFFSPVSKEMLLAMKPENEVLRFHEVFNVPFLWEDCLTRLINKSDSDWACFNNASENLLSGWALSGHRPLCTEDKKVVFIDDQADEWQITLNQLWGAVDQEVTKLGVFFYDRDAEPAGRFELSKVKPDCVDALKPADLVITDFYLEENHLTHYWQSAKELQQKSGFQLYNAIKKINKGVPVIMHTSSNKIPYYKVFDSYGVDNWLVKDIRPASEKSEKKDAFLNFKKEVEEILQNQYYKQLAYYWTVIKRIEEQETPSWWYTGTDHTGWDPHLNYRIADHSMKKLFINILKSSWFAIRRLINREEVFEETEKDGSNGFVRDAFTASAVCSNLGKILKLLMIDSAKPGFCLLTNFLGLMRNSASHESDYVSTTIDDAIIFLDYLMKLLSFRDSAADLNRKWPDKRIKRSYNGGYDQFEISLFWIYLQVYDQPGMRECCRYGYKLIAKRVNQLFEEVKEKDLIRQVLNNTPILGELKGYINEKGSRNYDLVPVQNMKKYIIEITN